MALTALYWLFALLKWRPAPAVTACTRTVSSTWYVTRHDALIRCDSRKGGFEVRLPFAKDFPADRVLVLKSITYSTKPIEIYAAIGERIGELPDGIALAPLRGIAICKPHGSVRLRTVPGGWTVVAAF